jgi:hypothetical protein
MLNGYAVYDYRKKIGQGKKACIEFPLPAV